MPEGCLSLLIEGLMPLHALCIHTFVPTAEIRASGWARQWLFSSMSCKKESRDLQKDWACHRMSRPGKGSYASAAQRLETPSPGSEWGRCSFEN